MPMFVESFVGCAESSFRTEGAIFCYEFRIVIKHRDISEYLRIIQFLPR